MTRRLLLAGSLALLAASCGSSPSTKFFALEPAPPERPPAWGRGPSSPLQVHAVSIPPALDRLSYVREMAPGRVDISDVARWAAPLDDSIRQILSADLRSRLPAAIVLAPGSPAPPNTRSVDVAVTRFMSDAAGNVTLEGDWTVLRSDSQDILAHQHDRLTGQAVSSDADQVVPVLSRLLGQLADRIAASP